MRTQEFYSFITERENIRLKKLAGLPRPWTDDPVLHEWKFTNVFRKYDRTTQELIDRFYSKKGQHAPRHEILLNCATFRYFGTWEFAEALGWQTVFQPERIITLAAERLKAKQRVFTGAYIITNQGIKAPKEEVVVNIFIRGLSDAMPRVLAALKSNNWEYTTRELQKVQGFGGSGFMAKETLLDTMHCKFWNNGLPDDYDAWTPVGPGARRGVNRILGLQQDHPITEEKCLDVIKELTSMQRHLWPSSWERLAPTDVQFQLCEFDKYNRVKLNEGRPRSRYISR